MQANPSYEFAPASCLTYVLQQGERGGNRDNRLASPLVCFPPVPPVRPRARTQYSLVVLGPQIPRDGRHGHSRPQLRGRQGRCEVGVDANGLPLAFHLWVR